MENDPAVKEKVMTAERFPCRVARCPTVIHTGHGLLYCPMIIRSFG